MSETALQSTSSSLALSPLEHSPGSSGRPEFSLPSDLEKLHRALAHFNAERFSPPRDDDWRTALEREFRGRLLEGAMVDAERVRVADAAARAPGHPQALLAWLRALPTQGPGHDDALLSTLAHSGTLDQLRWYLFQELHQETARADWAALVQVQLPARVRHAARANAALTPPSSDTALEQASESLRLTPSAAQVVWESHAVVNVMSALTRTRRYALQAVGALAVGELTAGPSARHLAAGLRRTQAGGSALAWARAREAQAQTAAEAWLTSVVRPLLADDPTAATPLAEGALLRLRVTARCAARYRRELAIPGAGKPL